MVSKWEAGGDVIRPRPFNQAALDTSLKMANAETRTRFEQLAAGRALHIEAGGPASAVRHLVRHPIDGKLMTLIEAGSFVPPAIGRSAVTEPVWLPAYYIDVYPTTSLDYARFVVGTGHRPPPQWPDGEFPHALAESLVQVPWLDAQAYAAWASKSLPTMVQWDRAATGEEGMVPGHLAEWCASANGPRRHEPATGTGGTQTGFRCALGAAEVLELLSI